MHFMKSIMCVNLVQSERVARLGGESVPIWQHSKDHCVLPNSYCLLAPTSHWAAILDRSTAPLSVIGSAGAMNCQRIDFFCCKVMHVAIVQETFFFLIVKCYLKVISRALNLNLARNLSQSGNTPWTTASLLASSRRPPGRHAAIPQCNSPPYTTPVPFSHPALAAWFSSAPLTPIIWTLPEL